MTVSDTKSTDPATQRMHRSASRRRRWVFLLQFAIDSLIWAVALATALIWRYEGNVPGDQWPPLLRMIVFAVLVQFVLGWGTFLYRGRHRHGTFDEVRTVVLTAGVTWVFVALANILLHPYHGLPRSVALISLPITLVLMLSFRYLRRLYVESRRGPGTSSETTLIYGAGYLGERVAGRLKTDRANPYWPVGLLDDDPDKRNVQYSGVRVLGTIDDPPEVMISTGAKVLLVAMANPSTELLNRVHDLASSLGLKVKVMPPLEELLEDDKSRTDFRDLQIEDLLGRAPLDTEIENVAGYLTGKRVLVTGAGGSIGSELCVQIARFEPGQLIMLGRDETALQSVQLRVEGNGLLDSGNVVLADIRDAESLKKIFAERQPEVVFHAAALKHLPLLEQYPDEGWKTNVIGTKNVLEAAASVNVPKFINVSTDKAANPTSVLGHSKRVAEKLTAWMGQQTEDEYISVRFGNVIGSRGSMLPTFQRLIEQGGPVTVTHPDVTRFFMTIPEACQLVIQAGGIGKTGEVLILDMGEPVRILDIAERMIRMSGRNNVDVVFTGLRPGEKLHEELIGDKERTNRPYHPKISHANVKSLSFEGLDYEGWRARILEQRQQRSDATLIAVESKGE